MIKGKYQSRFNVYLSIYVLHITVNMGQLQSPNIIRTTGGVTHL